MTPSPNAYRTVGSIPFQVTNLKASVDWLMERTEQRDAVSVRLANAYCVALASKDSDYRHVLQNDGVNFPDGTPVVWAMRARGEGGAQRVRGPSFFIEALEQQERQGVRPFFLGASPETLDALIRSIRSSFPRLDIAGAYSPPYAPVSEAYIRECADAVSGANADMVWVGLGTPKQDFVSTEMAARLRMPCAGVGAAFDFAAGTVSEPPKFVQNSGLEWLYRFASEPKRLWRRYTLGNAQFVLSVLKNWNSTP